LHDWREFTEHDAEMMGKLKFDEMEHFEFWTWSVSENDNFNDHSQTLFPSIPAILGEESVNFNSKYLDEETSYGFRIWTADRGPSALSFLCGVGQGDLGHRPYHSA